MNLKDILRNPPKIYAKHFFPDHTRIDYDKWKEQIQELMQQQNRLTKEEFRDILCEFPPSIAEDSGQPEWTQGELDKIWDFITKKNKYIFTEEKKLEEMKEQNSKLLKENEELKQSLEDAQKQLEKYCDDVIDNDLLQQQNSKLKEDIEEFTAEIKKRANVEKLKKHLTGECKVSWVEQGINVVCGHPLPCPKHTNIDKWRENVVQAISEEFTKGLRRIHSRNQKEGTGGLDEK